MSKKIKSIIFDMDGVIWKDNTPLADLGKIFDILNLNNISYVFATNNSMKTPESYQIKLSHFEVSVLQNQIITSGTTLANFMKNKFPEGGPVFIIGESGLVEPLAENGFYHQDKNTLAVAGGLDKMINYEKLSKATLNLAKADCEFYFTNLDPTYPSPDGNIPGAGSILAILETASGRKAKVTGKPEPIMFQQALKFLKTSSSETIVVGDRLNTDILGGINAGCMTALLLSGVTNKQDIKSSPIKPDIIAPDLRIFIEEMINAEWTIK
jgi:4-nitrophenyl phosphatase